VKAPIANAFQREINVLLYRSFRASAIPAGEVERPSPTQPTAQGIPRSLALPNPSAAR